jgi:hypothetical protein
MTAPSRVEFAQKETVKLQHADLLLHTVKDLRGNAELSWGMEGGIVTLISRDLVVEVVRMHAKTGESRSVQPINANRRLLTHLRSPQINKQNMTIPARVFASSVAE